MVFDRFIQKLSNYLNDKFTTFTKKLNSLIHFESSMRGYPLFSCCAGSQSFFGPHHLLFDRNLLVHYLYTASDPSVFISQMATRDSPFDLQIKLLMIGDSGA